MSYGRVRDCDGCDQSGATETLWLAAPLGLACVHVHRDRACAERARAARGGGRFVPEPMTQQEREQREEATRLFERIEAAETSARTATIALHERIAATLRRASARRGAQT